MCAFCGTIGCDPRCPNAPEPKVVYRCGNCKGDIREGDKYIRHGEKAVCEECVDDMTVTELLDLFEKEFDIA